MKIKRSIIKQIIKEEETSYQKFFKNLNTPKDVRDYLMQTSFGRDGSHG